MESSVKLESENRRLVPVIGFGPESFPLELLPKLIDMGVKLKLNSLLWESSLSLSPTMCELSLSGLNTRSVSDVLGVLVVMATEGLSLMVTESVVSRTEEVALRTLSEDSFC